MFDALIDEFEEDPTRAPEEEEGFAIQPVAEVDVEEIEDDLEVVVDGPVDQDVPLKPEEVEEELLSIQIGRAHV